MHFFFEKFIFILITASIFSCQNKNNLKQINKINLLEEKIENTLELEAQKNKRLNHVLNLSKQTLYELEKQRLDSMTIKLIYFEYREYLNSINKLLEIQAKSKEINKDIKINKQQFIDLKSDYKNSNNRRKDLDIYLKSEEIITNYTINKMLKIHNLTDIFINRFDSLNQEIKTIIHD
ncbi:MAG: hypothetical protein CMP65_01180 [Flavobacteriales bacterium]|nr:hypothetical protein [Flavobacteriales bacterium]